MKKTVNQRFVSPNGYVSLIGSALEMDQVVCSGERVLAVTSPGCWGPMITPSVLSGHEVTRPIRVQDAQVGDTIAFQIERVTVLSEYATSGVGKRYPQRFGCDPSLEAICPHCKTTHPTTVLSQIGENSVCCAVCGQPIIPQTIANGYTVAYDDKIKLGVTLGKSAATEAAKKTLAGEVFLPKGSQQHLATILGSYDVNDVIIRSRPMIGNIGCIPAKVIPSSKNSGDLIESLNSTGLYEHIEKQDITDGHMDISRVTEGCIFLSPVKVDGAGIYFGDVHLTQGNGELAGHTIDICAELEVKIHLLKGLRLDGPVILPTKSELDPRFLPFTDEEFAQAEKLRAKYGERIGNRRFPVQVVGSGSNLSLAIEDAVDRAACMTGLCHEEIKNLGTIAGGVDIGRTTGTVYLTLMLPEPIINALGLSDLVHQLYD